MFTELDRIDALLGTPAGTARAVLVHLDGSRVSALNDSLRPHGVTFGADTALSEGCQPAWEEVCKRAGVPPAWWMRPGGPPADHEVTSL